MFRNNHLKILEPLVLLHLSLKSNCTACPKSQDCGVYSSQRRRNTTVISTSQTRVEGLAANVLTLFNLISLTNVLYRCFPTGQFVISYAVTQTIADHPWVGNFVLQNACYESRKRVLLLLRTLCSLSLNDTQVRVNRCFEAHPSSKKQQSDKVIL